MNQTNSNKNIYDKLEVEGINSNGYGIMPKIIMQDNRLTIEAKAIYAYIVSFAGAGNTAFPSLKKILCDLNISENRFYKHRKQLINCNYITLRQIRNDKKEIIKNIYTLVSNPKIEKEGGTLQNEGYPIPQNEGYPIPQNEGYPIPQNEGYPIPQNEGHIINSSKINNIKINNKKEDSQSSPSFLPDDDDYINTNKQSDKQLSQPKKEKLDTQAELKQIIKSNEHLKTFALALLLAGLKEIDCLEILEYLASLPEIDQQVSDIVNAQIRANEIEAQTNGLSNYKAYFLKGLKMKLDNASIFVKETDITDVKNKKIDTNVIIHNWL